MSKEKVKKYLIILLAIVFIFNLAYSFGNRIKPSVDAGAYDRIAWNFAQGIGYLEDSSNQGMPEIDNGIGRVGPGYEFFLAGVYKTFGHHIWLIWIIQALFRVFSVFLIYKISTNLFKFHGEKIGLVAGVLFGLSPDLILIQGLLLTETLVIFLFLSVVYVFLKNLEKCNLKVTALLSLLLTLAFMTRPTFLLVFITVFALFAWKKRYKEALLLLLFPILLVTPWAVRNYQIYDHFIPTSATGGYDLWVGNNPEAKGGFDKTEEIQEIRNKTHIVELDKIGFKKYFSFIKEQPLKFTELQFMKTAAYFSGIRPTGFWPFLNKKPIQQKLTLGASGLWTGFLLLFGIAGGLLMFDKRKDLKAKIILFFAVLQPLAVIPVIVESRYRYSLFPFLAIFSAYFLVNLYKNRYRTDKMIRVFALSVLFMLTVTSVDFSYNAEEILYRLKLYF